MNLSIYSNAWKIYAANFWKLFSFAFSLLVIAIAGYVAIIFLGGADFYLVGLLIFSFLVSPFLYALQLTCLKASSGEEVEYNDFYQFFLGFYKSGGIGMYAVIKTFLLTGLACIISVFAASVIHDIIFPDVIELAVSSIKTLPDSPEYVYEVVNTVLNVEHFITILMICLAFGHIFIFVNLENRLMLPYFSLAGRVPLMIVNKVHDELYKENKPEFSAFTNFGNLIFLLAFLIGFIVCGLIASAFSDALVYIELIFVIAFAGGMIFSFFLLPPTIITYCFIADTLHVPFLEALSSELETLNKSLSDSGVENFETQKRMIDTILAQIKEQEKDASEETSDEE